MAARKFNMNDKVRVKLTDLGRQILRDQWEELRRDFPRVGEHTPPKEDAEGWSEWQLWNLISHFGAHIRIGFEVPFETTIEIPE